MSRELLLLALATVGSYPLGLALGQPLLLPLFNTAPAYALLVRRLVRGERSGAVGAMLLWALLLAVTGTVTLIFWPSPTAALVINGPAYRDEMHLWIQTGVGAEGDPRLFLPQHLRHLAVFVAASLASASALSMPLGAVMMNYMSFYVASLAQSGAGAGAVLLLGWQPWAICRVAGFVILGVILAEPLLARLRPSLRERLAPEGGRPFLIAAAALILLDWLLKAALAPSFGLALRSILG